MIEKQEFENDLAELMRLKNEWIFKFTEAQNALSQIDGKIDYISAKLNKLNTTP